jgi:hypothetical protein
VDRNRTKDNCCAVHGKYVKKNRTENKDGAQGGKVCEEKQARK